MAQITKATFGTNVNANYTANGVQAITGPIGNATFTNLKDSVVWYDERLNPINFPVEVIRIATTEPLQEENKYYVQKWTATIIPGVNAIFEDITHYVASSGTWETVSEFDNSKDYIVYVQGSTHPELGKAYLYDHRKLEGYKWIDLLEEKHLPHNYSLYKQGGNGTDEFYHINENSFNNINQLGNTIYYNYAYLVEALVVYGGTPGGASGYYLKEHASGSTIYDLISWDSFTGTLLVLVPSLNYKVYCKTTKETYMFDKSIGYFVSIGKEIHQSHNQSQELQGGNGIDEYYHLSAAEYSLIGATNSAYYYNINSVIQVVGMLSEIVVIPTTNDYIIANSESITAGVKLYKYNGSAWIAQPAMDKRYEVFNNYDKKVYFYDKVTDAFVEKGTNKLVQHNNTQGKQGGNGVDEFYHVDENTYLQLNANPEVILTVYIDPVNGVDTNNGLTVSTKIRTEARLVEILEGYKLDALVLNITSATPVTFTLDIAFEDYIIKTDLKNITFTSSLVSLVTGISFVNGTVSGTTLSLLKNAAVDLNYTNTFDSKGYPLYFNSGIISDSTSLRTFVPLETMYSPFDIYTCNVTVQFNSSGIYFNNIGANKIILYLNNVRNVTTLTSYSSYIYTNVDVYIYSLTLNDSYIYNNSLISTFNSYINTSILNISIFNSLNFLRLDGYLQYNGYIRNHGNIETTSISSIIGFINNNCLFDSKPGSNIVLNGLENVISLNVDSTPVLDSTSEGFYNQISFANPLQSVNADTYLRGTTKSLYTSEGSHFDMQIGTLRFLSNKNNYDHISVPLNTTISSDATFEIGSFIHNRAIKLKLSVRSESAVSRHYYKDIHIVLKTNGGNAIEVFYSGVNSSSDLVESATGMFSIVGNILYLTLKTATVAYTADVNIEVERVLIN